jgi:hypothetical protein
MISFFETKCGPAVRLLPTSVSSKYKLVIDQRSKRLKKMVDCDVTLAFALLNVSRSACGPKLLSRRCWGQASGQRVENGASDPDADIMSQASRFPVMLVLVVPLMGGPGMQRREFITLIGGDRPFSTKASRTGLERG